MTAPLSIAIDSLDASPAPAEDPAARVRRLLGIVRTAGYRAVTLGATVPGVRPRDLDRSARRELAALLRRDELAFTGLDLWIPADHFASPSHADRAATAVGGACELADELLRLSRLTGGAASGPTGARPVVCVSLPEHADAGVLAAIRGAADRTGVVVANFAWPLEEAIGREPGDPITVGLDPASAVLGGADAANAAAKWGARIGAARLSDASRRAGSRVVPGSVGGELDIVAFKVSLCAAAAGAPVIADLRGTASPVDGASSALRAWDAAATIGAP